MRAAGPKHTSDQNQASAVTPGASAALRREKYGALARVRLQGPLTRLFSQLTDLHLLVAWAPPPGLSWDSALPFCRTEACGKICRDTQARTNCARFEKGCLAHALQSGAHGYEFTCPFGVRSFWLPIVLNDLCLGIMFIQLPPNGCAGRPSGKEGIRYEADGVERRRRVSRRHRFRLAKGLLRLIVHDVAQSALAQARGSQVDRLARNVAAHDKLEDGLRQALHRVLPFVVQHPPPSAAETRCERIVHRMIEHVHEQYGQPMGLQQVAGRLGMNTAYLSALFSKTVGLPFRSYLKELRLEKAQALLSDPLRRISEIAYAVGYTDPNRFRLDFKERTGLSPSAWRDTLTPVSDLLLPRQSSDG